MSNNVSYTTPIVPVTTTSPGGTRTINMPVMPVPSGTELTKQFMNDAPSIPQQVKDMT